MINIKSLSKHYMTNINQKNNINNIKEDSWIQKLDEEIKKARNNLKTEKMDMSFGELMSMYENNELIISPSFQRLFRWNSEQKTKFIESLLPIDEMSQLVINLMSDIIINVIKSYHDQTYLFQKT